MTATKHRPVQQRRGAAAIIDIEAKQQLPVVGAEVKTRHDISNLPTLTAKSKISAVLRIPYHEIIDLTQLEFEEKLGSGSFSDVYRATTQTQETVAVKIYHLGIGLKDANDYNKRREAFFREKRSLEDLTPTEQIPKFFGVAATPKERGKFAEFEPALIMEYIDGITLEDSIKEKKHFSSEEIRDIAEQALSPLEKIHHGNSIPRYHRDIKPANLKKSSSGLLYLLDFGSMRDEIIGSMGGTMAMGTPAYAHPQQVYAGKPTFRTELYSLGRTLYAISVGERLEEKEYSLEKLKQTNLDTKLKEIIAALCDQDLTKGPQHVRELREWLENRVVIDVNNTALADGQFREKTTQLPATTTEVPTAITPSTKAYEVDQGLEARMTVYLQESKKRVNRKIWSLGLGVFIEGILLSLAWKYEYLLYEPNWSITLSSLILITGIGSNVGYLKNELTSREYKQKSKELKSIPAAVQFGEQFDEDVCFEHFKKLYESLDASFKVDITDASNEVITKKIYDNENNWLRIRRTYQGPSPNKSPEYKTKSVGNASLTVGGFLQIKHTYLGSFYEKVASTMTVEYHEKQRRSEALKNIVQIGVNTKERALCISSDERVRLYDEPYPQEIKYLRTRQDLEAMLKEKNSRGDALRMLEKTAPTIYTTFLAMLPEEEKTIR